MRRCCLLLLTAGCAEWPRYDNLPELESGQANASADPRDALWNQIHWGSEGPEIEVNDAPPNQGIYLDLLGGWTREGSLDGWGWDATSEYRLPVDTTCGREPEFPPQELGYYSGDVDWYGVVAGDSGTLCANVKFRIDGQEPDRRYDLMLYRLDDCSVPIDPARLDYTPEGYDEPPVLGYPLGGTEGSWGSPVLGTENLGIALAGWTPESEDAVIHYIIAVSLVPTGTTEAAGLCPRIPEDL